MKIAITMTLMMSSSIGFAATKFTCAAPKHAVVIDEDKDGMLRYRSWDVAKDLSKAPDLEIRNGKMQIEGTGPCRYFNYVFSKGRYQYEVEAGVGCTNPDNPEPKGATGKLTVSKDEKMLSSWWCKAKN